MSEFSLTAKQIQENYLKLRARISKLFPTRSDAILRMLDAFGEERLMFAPASGTNYYHNAIPGGYVDHVLRVMDFSLIEYKKAQEIGIDVSGFTIEELMFAALNHDLGKLGFVGEGKDGYVFNDSSWHREKLGKIYKPNDNIPFRLVQDASLFLLQTFNISCTWNEYLAIRIHDGVYDDANKAYYFSRSLESKQRNYMPQLLHQADMAATRFEFERWVKSTNSLNCERLETSRFEPSATVTDPIKTQKQKKKEEGEKLVSAFDDIFGNSK